jgi:signal transduction histidine kinase
MDGTPRPATTALAWSLTALSVGLGVSVLALGISGLHRGLGWAVIGPIWAPFPVTVGLIAWQRPRNSVGWVLLFTAIGIGLFAAASTYGTYAATVGRGLPGAVWALWLQNQAVVLVYPGGSALLLMMLLPNGRLPSRRWRALLFAAAVFTVAIFLITAMAPAPVAGENGSYPTLPNPLRQSFLKVFVANGELLENLVWAIGCVLLLIAGSAPFQRARKARGDEREQVRWIAYVVLMTVVANLISASLLVIAPTQQSTWSTLNTLVNLIGFGVGLPVSAAVAIFKYRLYDIDLIISRTLVFGALAVFITAVYVGLAVGVGSLIGSGGQPNLALSIVATAIVAVGFEPLRERLQRLANRLVYGSRATPYEILSQFSDRVAGSYSAADVLPRMARVLAEGTAAQRGTVWLRSGRTLVPAASWPEAGATGEAIAVTGQLMPPLPDANRTVAVRHEGELLGALSVRKRPGEPLSSTETALLQDLANQAGLVLRNVGLTADLVRHLEDLESSRRRLLAAQGSERARIERDLQHGAQRTLAELRRRLAGAGSRASADPAGTRQLTSELMEEADEALQALRELARGIYPPLLADRGLGAAIEAHARRMPIAVTVDADVGRYPREVESSVYFCILEALRNVEAHAHARLAAVCVRREEGGLTFEVTDDGDGFDADAPAREGGLTTIRDRLDAAGGRLEIGSVPGKGTSLRAWLPAPAQVPAPA